MGNERRLLRAHPREADLRGSAIDFRGERTKLEPKSPDDLSAHDLVTITKDGGATQWPFVDGGKEKRVATRVGPKVLDDARQALVALLDLSAGLDAVARRKVKPPTT